MFNANSRSVCTTSAPLAFVFAITLTVGCGMESDDKVIADMIKGGLSVKDDVIANSEGIFTSYDVYQDGNSKGVVFEYTIADGVQLDPSMLTDEIIKGQAKEMLSKDKNTQKVLDRGIHVRFVYKQADGSTFTDVKIDQDDFDG